MKNYRQLQNCLAGSLDDLKVQRLRAENIFNDLIRYLEGHQGVPKECVFFALFPEGRDPLFSPGAKDFVILEDDRTWSCHLVFRIHETGPQGETSNVVLVPKIAFVGEGEVRVSIQETDLETLVNCPPDSPTTTVTEPLAELVTEAAALRIARLGGGDDRQIGFGAR